MRLLITIFILLAISVTAQNQNPNYDKALADSLKADDYGMKTYIFVILKTGTAKIDDKKERSKLFRGHLDNISRLTKEGKIIVAGPFMENEKTYRGLFIFDVKTIDEVRELLKTDPTIKSGIFETEIFEWYGSAALSEYLKTADKIWKVNP